MEQQYNSYYIYPQGNSKPRTQPTGYMSSWPVPAGLDMTRNGSNDSAYYSASTEFSDDAYYPKRSPAAMSFSASSPNFYENDHLATQQYMPSSYLEPSPPLQSFASERSHSSRATPSSLGWTPERTFLSFYKFVIPKGKEPFFELLEGCIITHDTPAKVFLDSPKTPRKNEFPCLYPGCDDKIFKRPADLERHYRNVHGDSDQKESYCCDYPPCKARGAFNRKDHFRDHLRDYHKEDIGSMKKEKNRGKKEADEKKWLKLQAAWIKERKIEAKWWRCPKCLQRVHIADFGYDCQTCKYPCDRERADRIRAYRATRARDTRDTRDTYVASAASNVAASVEYAQTSVAPVAPEVPYSPICVDCEGTGWLMNPQSSAEVWAPCSTCSSHTSQDSESYGNWDNGGYASSSRYY